jgi:LmbE family N-acetylglucosaminyl deacetylase
MTEDVGFSRAMVVVAHADDAEFGCSGTVARWCAEGWEVVYVICTDGSKGSSDPQMTQEKLKKLRRKEQIAAGEVLGLKYVVFLDREDSMLQPTLDLRRDIAREIRRHRPEVLVCQNPTRNLRGHPDHLAAGEAALSAVFPTARDRLIFPELLDEGLEPHNVSEVWVMGGGEPDLWVDVTDHIDTAAEALSQHASQLSRDRAEVAESIRRRRRRTAEGRGMQYAEAFRRIIFERPPGLDESE